MSHRWLGTRATGTVQWGMVFLSYCCYRILYPSRKQKTQLSPVYLASSCKSSFLFPIILPFHWWPQPFILEEAKFDFPSPTGSFEMATAVLSQWTSQTCWDYYCRLSGERTWCTAFRNWILFSQLRVWAEQASVSAQLCRQPQILPLWWKEILKWRVRWRQKGRRKSEGVQWGQMRNYFGRVKRRSKT